MSKPDPPTPPNPYDTARAATGTNVSTAVANAFLNNTNQVTPTGSIDYNQTGNYDWTDPSTGSTYSIPRFTATQTLSPTQQAIQGQTEATQYNLAGMANAQSGRISSLLSNNVNLGGAPAAGSADSVQIGAPMYGFSSGGPVQTGLSYYGNQTFGFGPAGDVTKSYGPSDNFSADRQRVEDSLMARMNPQLQIQRSALEQKLSDQGIRYGSQAYNDAMATYQQQENDARWGAVSQAGQEQQRMTTEAAQLAAFQNSAQQQEYQQAQGRGQFYNTAQEQQYQEALGAGAFANQAQAQNFSQNSQQAQFYNQAMLQQQQQRIASFNAANQSRNQYMQEQYAYRNQPINEISALLSGSQVTNPNFVNTPNSQIPTTDVAGIINQNYAQQMQAYQQQSSNYNNLIGGILGLGASVGRGALAGSDIRMKENIERIGTVLSDVDHDETPMASVFGHDPDRDKNVHRLPIYRYSYKDDPASTPRIGPMAQDVEKIDRGAVHNIGGRKYIDVDRVMGGILKAA